jgi:hypothetical protein
MVKKSLLIENTRNLESFHSGGLTDVENQSARLVMLRYVWLWIISLNLAPVPASAWRQKPFP